MLVSVFQEVLKQQAYQDPCWRFLTDALGTSVDVARVQGPELLIETPEGHISWDSVTLFKKLKNGPRKITMPVLFLLCLEYDVHHETSELIASLLAKGDLQTGPVVFFYRKKRVRTAVEVLTSAHNCKNLVRIEDREDYHQITLRPHPSVVEVLLNRLEEVAL